MIIVMITFLILLVVGVPVGFSIAISGFTYFFQHPELPIPRQYSCLFPRLRILHFLQCLCSCLQGV